MEIPPVRPRSGPELLDAAFQLVRAHGFDLLRLIAWFLLPSVALQVLAGPDLRPVATLVGNLLTLGASLATSILVADVYLGRPVDHTEILRRTGRRYRKYWGACFIQTVLVGLGLLLLVIPGVIAYVWTFALPTLAAVEGARATESTSRARALVRGNFWRVLGIMLLAYLLWMVPLLGVSVLSGTVEGLFHLPLGSTDILGDATGQLLYPFVSVVSTLLYFDLRVRNEALDLSLAVDALVPAEAPAEAALA